MALNTRQIEITRLISRHKTLQVNDLASELGTSAVTIRKDLDLLQSQGLLLRTHGGAVLAEDIERTVTIDKKLAQATDLKDAVAERALDMVFDCQTLALDAGSTTLALAERLRGRDICVVTNSLLIAQALQEAPSGRVVMLGGTWRRESSCYIGPVTTRVLEGLNIDMAFVGASGFTPDSGFTCQNSMEAQVKTEMLRRADRRFVVSDHTKLGQRAFTTFARFDEVDALITDDGMDRARVAELKEHSLTVFQNKGEPDRG